ncbi:hypothetical protein B0H19DRAFT_1138090, partial [Mycena capillaripes]
MAEWAAHLIRFKDGRFAHHPRFCYWVLNTILWHDAKKASKWYTTTHHEDKELMVADIQQMLNDDDAKGLADRVAHAVVRLPGSRPFWQKSQRRALNPMRCPLTRVPLQPYQQMTKARVPTLQPTKRRQEPRHVMVPEATSEANPFPQSRRPVGERSYKSPTKKDHERVRYWERRTTGSGFEVRGRRMPEGLRRDSSPPLGATTDQEMPREQER